MARTSLAAYMDERPLVRGARSSARDIPYPFELLKAIVVIVAAEAVTARMGTKIQEMGIEPFASLGGAALFGIGLLVPVVICYCLLWEDLRPGQIGLSPWPVGSTFSQLARGYAIGSACMLCAWGAAVLLGGLAFAPSPASSTMAIGWMWGIYLFQACGEEVLYRGLAMVALARRSSATVALVTSSVLFSLHHHFNAGFGPLAFVNLFLFALVCGLSVLSTGRIWTATAIHGAWNFVQGNVLGVNVSGSPQDGASTILMSSPVGPTLVSGGQMGLEGSLATTLVLIAALALLAALALGERRCPARTPRA